MALEEDLVLIMMGFFRFSFKACGINRFEGCWFGPVMLEIKIHRREVTEMFSNNLKPHTFEIPPITNRVKTYEQTYQTNKQVDP